MKSIQAAACLGISALLAACATTDNDHFYTLNGPVAASAPANAAAGQPVYIEMLAVNVPAQVKRKELVVTTGAGKVDMLDHHRWIGPLADEIGHALSLQVSGELGAIDVY